MKAIDLSRPAAAPVRARDYEGVLRASIRSAAVMGVALRQSAGSPPRLVLPFLLIAELMIQGCINSLGEVTPIKLTPEELDAGGTRRA
jgi:hypothetical protein